MKKVLYFTLSCIMVITMLAALPFTACADVDEDPTPVVITEMNATVSGFIDGGSVSATTVTTTDTEYTVALINWYDCTSVFSYGTAPVLSANDTFEGGKVYTVGVHFLPTGSNTIADNVDVTINDKNGKIGGYRNGGREFFVTIDVPVHTHEFTTLCFDADNHWYECTCGAKQDAEPHNFNTVVTPATFDTSGAYSHTCTVCGYQGETENDAIPAIKSAKLSKTAYVYDGKAKKPAVTVKDSKGDTIAATYYTVTYADNKKAGKATATVQFKGNYTGTKKLTFTINPKGTSLSKVTTPKKKQLKVTWNKQTTQTTGYQLQYSTSSKFTTKTTTTVTVSKNKTTSKTISKLKSGKKYYVRIRTYKTVGKTKYYSAWSKSKSIKVK